MNLVIRILKPKNYLILEKPYKVYIKDKFSISPNYNSVKTYYTEFNDYILLNLCGLIVIINFKNLKYLFTLLDIVTKWLNFRLLRTKIKKEALLVFKDIKIAAEN